MLKKTAAAAVLAATALLGTSPALADGGHRGFSRDRVVVADRHGPGFGHRGLHARGHIFGHRGLHEHRHFVVHRPFVARPIVYRPAPPPPAVVYYERRSHDVLGGLIVGAVLGAAIASHGGY